MRGQGSRGDEMLGFKSHAKPRAAPPKRIGRAEAAAWYAVAVAILAWPTLERMFSGKPASISPRTEVAAASLMQPGRGRDARAPQDIPAKGWKDILWRTWSEFNEDRIPTVAGGVSFFGLLALFPALGAFVSLYGLFADVKAAREQLRLLAGLVPREALDFVGDQMTRLAEAEHASLGLTFLFTLLVSLWSANAGVKALFDGLNVAYEEREKRGLVRLNLISLAFTFGAIAFLVLSFAGVVAVPVALALVGLPDLGFMSVLRWPILFAVAIAGLSLLYRYGPSREHARWRWITWGSVIGAALWLAASMVFSFYVSRFGHYDRTYGSLGAVVGFMSWLWISIIVVLVGAEINAEIEHQTAVDSTTGAPKVMGRRGAKMADTLGKTADAVADTPPHQHVPRVANKDANRAGTPAMSDGRRD